MYKHIKKKMLESSKEKQKIKKTILNLKYQDNFDYFCELNDCSLKDLTIEEFNDIVHKICEEHHFKNLYYEITDIHYCQIYFSKSY